MDVCLDLNIPCGGTCPRGRLAEDGPIAKYYPLSEHDSSDYRARTKQNILDSHGTLITSTGPLDGGSKLTFELCQKLGRPVLHLEQNRVSSDEEAAALEDFLVNHFITILNVAGPRASKSPEVYEYTYKVLQQFLKKILD